MFSHSPFTAGFSGNHDFDYEIRVVLGHAISGASDVGEVLAAVADVKDKDHEAWFSAWSTLGDRVAQQADDAAAGGHAVSAAAAFLRASTYYAVAVNALSALESDDQLAATFRKHRAAWDRWVDAVDLDVERVAIPYEDTTLPGYFFRAPVAGMQGSGPGPVLVAVNGSDGSLPSLWSACVGGALLRGYHALVFDGPGQQSMLFDHDVPFRPDFEAVLTPVLDWLVDRSDVDNDRMAVYGISQAGYWVTRALAFEHRPVAAVVDPGVVDVAASWTREIPHSLLKLLDKGDDHAFDRDMELGMRLSKSTARTWRFRARPYGADGYAATVREVHKYDATDVAGRITTPLLITAPEDEQFWPGQSEQLAQLTPDVSTLVRFTAAEGADRHCQPLARGLTEQRMFDWLDQRITR
ncbi:X-Pro dipeptidyl-peptidase (S15 family) [Sanguibacter gelidistatuariae]|uniref:X-Pro dipeptidyl-peptidase (S15 family) n=1 Tax=Sanguibacter gelidistatuariae TaxID=1814289 RepID=A0A1G6XPC2_9MICO|nr:CocE/NonD family hydrolase [Sanguibacter gelidistatuariae]SDD79146.1 X-Pro dipeptidyl-peptidase (S15 family) [Sanguibacter gelidistatuariae]